jgi:hypothetical protein
VPRFMPPRQVQPGFSHMQSMLWSRRMSGWWRAPELWWFLRRCGPVVPSIVPSAVVLNKISTFRSNTRSCSPLAFLYISFISSLCLRPNSLVCKGSVPVACPGNIATLCLGVLGVLSVITAVAHALKTARTIANSALHAITSQSWRRSFAWQASQGRWFRSERKRPLRVKGW